MMRLREIKKEIERQESILKSAKASYDSQPAKDGPIARMALNRMAVAQKKIGILKGRCYES